MQEGSLISGCPFVFLKPPVARARRCAIVRGHALPLSPEASCDQTHLCPRLMVTVVSPDDVRRRGERALLLSYFCRGRKKSSVLNGGIRRCNLSRTARLSVSLFAF